MTQRLLLFGVIIVVVGLSGAVWLPGIRGDPARERSDTWGPWQAEASGAMGPGGMRGGGGWVPKGRRTSPRTANGST